MKNKLSLISIALSILLIISTIFTISTTHKLNAKISDLQLEIQEVQAENKESFKITQEEIDALYQLSHTENEELLNRVDELTTQLEEAQEQIGSLQDEVNSLKKKLTNTSSTTKSTGSTQSSSGSPKLYTANEFKTRGVINWNGWKWTWYTERMLPGEGLNIPGRHTDSEGWVRDGDGYLCIASSTLPKGTIIDTPFGSQGKVYDCGCAVGTADVYTNW